MPCTDVRGRWRFCRLGTLVPGPEGLRRPWDTGAAGSGAPELIGDPGNNKSWKAGGLIGPGSGLAFCLKQGPTTGRAVPAAELRLAAGTQRSASRATLGRDVHGGRRGKEGTTLLAAPGARGLSTSWSITPLQRQRDENAAATTPPCPAFATTLLGVPSVPGAPPVAPGRCCPLVSAARSIGCCKPAVSCQLPFLDVLTVRNWKQRTRGCSSNLRGVFSPNRPRISALPRRNSI